MSAPSASGSEQETRPHEGEQPGRGERAPRPSRTERDELARAALGPLAEGEWPGALLIAIAVAAVLAVAVVVSLATVHDLHARGGSLAGGAFLAAVLAGLAAGMYRRRYWAVLGFQALLAFQIIVGSLALVVASTWLAAGVCVVSVGLAGWLFWKLVRVLGRIAVGGLR
ncbi:MAG TPA: hypothetical protein VGX16_01370 [Solirubrobacteraceae bacterium]|nr:hypothetical protein [Solirubrobacteraceae bacterium]